MLNLIEASNKTDLDIAAHNARIFANSETRKEDRKNRRAGVPKSSPTLNLLLWRVFAFVASILISLILLLAKNN